MKKYKNIEYIIHQTYMGHYCGYVRLPDDHPFVKLLSKKHWYQVSKELPRRYVYDYDAVPVECHGGLTFGQKITNNKLPQGFSKGWWIGWDYAHPGDCVPMFPYDKVWTYEEVEKECKNVIRQLLKNY